MQAFILKKGVVVLHRSLGNISMQRTGCEQQNRLSHGQHVAYNVALCPVLHMQTVSCYAWQGGWAHAGVLVQSAYSKGPMGNQLKVAHRPGHKCMGAVRGRSTDPLLGRVLVVSTEDSA